MYKIYYNLVDESLSSDNSLEVSELSKVENLLARMDKESDIYIYDPHSKKRVLIYSPEDPAEYFLEVHSGGAIVIKKQDKRNLLESLDRIETILANPYKCGFVDWEDG